MTIHEKGSNFIGEQERKGFKQPRISHYSTETAINQATHHPRNLVNRASAINHNTVRLDFTPRNPNNDIFSTFFRKFSYVWIDRN